MPPIFTQPFRTALGCLQTSCRLERLSSSVSVPSLSGHTHSIGQCGRRRLGALPSRPAPDLPLPFLYAVY